jgi:hypothetical protein
MERDFESGGRKFKLNKIDAIRQWHIVRRIGPLLTELMPQMAKLGKMKEDMTEEQKFAQIVEALTPFMNGLSKLSDENADYVLFRLLGSVEVLQSEHNRWSRVAVDTGILMQDIELPLLLQAAGRALFFNLSNFLDLLPRKA